MVERWDAQRLRLATRRRARGAASLDCEVASRTTVAICLAGLSRPFRAHAICMTYQTL